MTDSASTPLSGVDVLLADLDGVVYRGPDPLPYAVESINRSQKSLRVGYITNNASRTAESVAAHLCDLGLTVDGDDVVTSSQAAAQLLVQSVPSGSTVLVVGGEGLTSVLESRGFRVTRSAEGEPAAVVQGFHPDVAWTDLAQAAFALKAPADGGDGIPWIATNTDWTIPQPQGTAPGNGTLVSAVHTAIGRLPIVAGKPERPIFDAAVERFAAKSPLVLGDRLDTDILGANRAGIVSALVLTGIDGPKQVIAADAESRPRFLLGDLRELFEPYPFPIEKRGRSGARLFESRSSVVRLEGNSVRIDEEGESDIDLLRAGTAAVWGAGVPIYALDVAPALYS